MKPLKLTMQAFGSYSKKTTIDFTRPNQNLFLVTGDTGAGKTTIFDAIVFAIYGEASSGSNKKDGTELQSQFAAYTVEPFVELIFSEKNGEQDAVYTVQRIPRHVRPLKRGSGSKEESERVSLRMPDGTEYPQKETDRKLEEIVGLTKKQFMQVAMIAQGEFMELLRAKSDDKKVIFRKLFHTDLFQHIVDELGKRRREKLSDMAEIRTVCQTEVGRIVVPEDYEDAEALQVVRKRVLTSDKLSVTDMEAVMAALEKLCHMLDEHKKNAQKAYEEAGRLRDRKRDAYTGAIGLQKSYEQWERAEKELAECAAAEKEIEETVKRIAAIDAAYEIRSVYQRFSDVENTVFDMEERLKEQLEVQPELARIYRKASDAETEAKRQQEIELESFAKVSERVKKALSILDKIRTAKKETAAGEAALKCAETAEAQAEQQLKALEIQEQKWRKQVEELSSTDILLERWKRKEEEAGEIENAVSLAKKLQCDVKAQKRKAEKAQQEYSAIRQKFAGKNAEYAAKNTAFLDAQAGFLAREKLKPGEPCPVCGSKEHPHPCDISKDYGNLTREIIENLAREVAAIQQKQQKKAQAAGSTSDLLAEKKSHLEETMRQLQKRMAKSISNVPEPLTQERAEALLTGWKQEIEREGAALQKNAEILIQIRNSLKDIDTRKQSLKEAAEREAQNVVNAKTTLAGSRAALAGFEADRDYLTAEEANAALAEAAATKNKKEDAWRTANKEARAAKERLDHTGALIARYHKELPEQKEERDRRKATYEKSMEEKELAESEWKDITMKYLRSETDRLQAEVEAYHKKKATAEGMRESAKKAIDDRNRPNLVELESAKRQAEEQLAEAQRELERFKDDYKANLNAYHALAPKMEERSRVMREYTRLDSLYNRLAGKVSGSRMDIETFVQRYYLQRILYAANARFYEMSAGQFELRMVGTEQAGEGKNRGLDLMVYSTVTGKEREVRTLSGGESFMAALSLALGMADQIQESSAAIHLDVMFIDEGFGSLDDHSREQAVKVLQQMAGSSRLIGIISHVTELKQEIEDQLIVAKGEEGSYVRWQIS